MNSNTPALSRLDDNINPVEVAASPELFASGSSRKGAPPAVAGRLDPPKAETWPQFLRLGAQPREDASVLVSDLLHVV